MTIRKCVTLGLSPSFGFGDRIGLATPGHVEAMRRAGGDISPIFPQQSIREMTRTGRTASQVMNEAMEGAESAGWTGVTGADADHLKTVDDVDLTSAAGYTFFTIDPSGHVDQQTDDYDEPTLRERFRAVQGDAAWFNEYEGKTVELSNGTRVVFTEQACMRAAVKYGVAIREALYLGSHIHAVHLASGRDYEIELSVDETDQPTTLAEHFIIADQCLRGGMRLVSLAPRFMGDFEKGIDYKGDLQALERSLVDHAAVSERLGPYKLSLHSGSDKLSMYPALARATNGRFHVKTAGTSYLEAVRVAARHDEALFRAIIDLGRSRYDTDKATYHVSATLDDAPSPQDIDDVSVLEREYLGRWDDVPDGKGFTNAGRQILHCTFGSALLHPEYGPALRALLETFQDTYTEVLTDHFTRHLEALRIDGDPPVRA